MITKFSEWNHEVTIRVKPELLNTYQHCWNSLSRENYSEIFIDTNTDDYLIISYLDTPDEGIIPILVIDAIVPYWITDNELKNTEFIEACGFKVETSRYDAVIDLKQYKNNNSYQDNFNFYKRTLSSKLTRYWNKCEKTFFTKGQNLNTFGYFYNKFAKFKAEYWEAKLGKHQDLFGPDFIYGISFADVLITQCKDVGDIDTVLETCCFSWYYNNPDNKELQWANTFRDYKYKDGLGTYNILKGIQFAFDNNLDYFNMGISIFDYKNQFNKIDTPVKGIRKL